MMNNHTKD